MSSAALWLGLALVLGTAELLAPGVFLLFLAIAAAITGATLLAFPDLPLVAQLGSFGVWSAVTVAIGRHWYAQPAEVEGDGLLNDPGARLIGETVLIADGIVDGRGRATLGDSQWLARGPEMAPGGRARIVAVDGSVLVVEPLPLSDQVGPDQAG